MTIQPRVVDISHHNTVKDFGQVARAGVYGVIHKASQGRAYADPDYARRRPAAKAANLLWGAYHFGTGDDVKTQVQFFLKCAQPDNQTLMVLDYEDNRQSNMNIEQAVSFLHELEKQLGRKGAIYSGNRIKETIGQLGKDERDYLTSHRLWLCQYGPLAKLPLGFSRYWLWQYSDGVIGPGPHGVAGLTGDVDLNSYSGTRDQLSSEWA